MSILQKNSAVLAVRKFDVLHWISAAKAWLSPAGGPLTTYNPHGEPPYAVVPQYGGMQVKIELGGRSALLLGDTFVPLPNCPSPDVAFSLALRVWWVKRPLEVFAAGTAALLLLASFVALLSLSSPHSEYTATLAWGASQGLALLFYAGSAIAALAICSFAFWNFGKGITIGEAAPAGQKLLGAGELPGIGSDIPVFARENETPAVFAQRMADAKREAVEGQMVVALPFRSQYIVCFQKGGDSEAVLSGQSTRWAVAHKSEQVYAEGADVSIETYEEYFQFVRWYADGFEAWATAQRIRMSADPFGSLTRLMSRMSAALLLLLVSLSVSAQGNAGKVEAYLGDVRAGMKPRGEVQYVFVRRVFTRKADGTKNFVETLQTPVGVAAFDNDEALGNLLAISNNGVMLERVDAPAAPPIRAASVAAPVSARPIPESMGEIDSTDISGWLDEGGKASSAALKSVRTGIKMWWESKLWQNSMQVLWFLIGLARLTADMFLSENRRSQFGNIYGAAAGKIGDWAALTTLFFFWVFVLVFAANVYVVAVEGANPFYLFWSILWNVSTFLVLGWLLFVYWLGRISDWIVPNPKVRPTHGGPSYPSQHSPRLGAGDKSAP